MNRINFINVYLFVIIYLIKIVTSKHNIDDILSKAQIAEYDFRQVQNLPGNFSTKLDTLHSPIKRRSPFLEPGKVLDQLFQIMDPGTLFLKVWNGKGERKAVLAKTYKDLVEKGVMKLGLTQTPLIYLEDGTEISEDVYGGLSNNTVLYFLMEDDHKPWNQSTCQTKKSCGDSEAGSSTQTEVSSPSEIILYVPCNCGEGMIKCLHHPDGKICECSNNRVVINGMCTDCECYNGVCIMVGEFRQCRCLRGFGLQDNTCVECQCGAKKRFCHFVEGLQFCNCDDEYISVNEKCEDCMCGKDEVCLKRPQIGVCTCPKGSGTWDDEECDECDCSDGKSCMYVGSQKLCTCMPRKAKLNGTCVECDCGENAECEFVDGEKTCSCQDGYEMHNGTCEECYCGEGHSCTFKNGSSVCICAENYYAHNGTCKSCTCGPNERCEIIDGKQFCICKENFIKINNSCIACWCGEGHACNIVDGKKLCLCQEGFAANNGKCEKCDCGANYASCEFQNGKKECECHEGYAGNNGICQECFCGKNSTCLFENGEKLCFCPEDQQQSNGMCIVWMCLEDTCHRGTCEVNENGFFCNCEDGYSGHRCDEEALLSQGAIYLISVLSALTLFWVILLLVFIIRKRNRYRHYHHEKLDATMNVLSEENPDSAM